MTFARLLLLGLLAAPPAFAKDRIECNVGNDLTPPFNPATALTSYCAAVSPEQCKATITKELEAAKELNERLKATCAKVEQIDHDLAETVGMEQRAAIQSQIAIYSSAKEEYTAFSKSLSEWFKAIGDTMTPATGPLGRDLKAADLAAAEATDKYVRQRAQIRSAITDKTLKDLRALPVGEVRQPESAAPEAASIFAARNGALYMQRIMARSDEVAGSIAMLTNGIDKSKGNLANLDRADRKDDSSGGGTKKAEATSGLDLKSLAGLATAGAGLAQLMNKKKADASTADAGATSPTPSSPAGKSGPPEPSVSKLGDSGKGDSKLPAASLPTKKDPAASPRVPSGQAYNPYSDINKSQGATFATNASSPAVAKSGGGGGGAGGRSGGSDADANAAKAAAVPSPPVDEAMQGLGGGLLGGGGGPPPLSAGTAPPPGAPGAEAASPEASMTDLLHEMKETAEGAGPNAALAGGTDIAMADDDLFPRVRSCYVRIMKAGRVLDSLGEKITPEAQ